MPQQFRHLQYDERCQIQALLQQGFSVTAIAAQLQRHKSTVYRELQRNAGLSGYHHEQAQPLARDRRHRAVTGPRKLQPAIWNLISDGLQSHWSPEQVAGYLKRVGAVSVSFSWLYQRIRQDRAQGGSLYTYLRQRGKPRRCKATRGSAGRGCIPGRRDISERPAIVDSKQRCGDWEADTIIGKAHKGAAVTLVERKSKYLLAQTVSRKTAALVGDAMQNLLRPFAALVLTVTCDNGKEFAGHLQTAEALETDLFFARPYRSCERGLNEHTNGLLRQFVPKTENLRTLDPQRLQEAVNRLNHRPRKVLGYRTPYEVFRDDCLAAGIDPPPAIPDPSPL